MTKSLLRQGKVGQFHRSRLRNGLLTATAFSGAFGALMAANPQSALAACAITAAPNTVNCAATTTTTNTTNTNAGAAASNDSEQLFTAGGNVTGQVSAAINGFGLSIESTEALANVSNNNSGSITNDAGVPGPAGGTAVENLSAVGGTVTYTGNGSITSAAAFPTDALVLTTTGGGNINVTTGSSPITGGGGGFAGAGIVAQATTALSGNIAIVTGTGLISGGLPSANGGTGVIDASTINSGAIFVTVGAGGVLAASSFGFPDAIATRAVDGNTTIVTNGLLDTATNFDGNGINASATGLGGISVTANTNVTANLNGIATSVVNGNTEIDVDNAGTTITSASGKPGFGGISATSTGVGNIVINLSPLTAVVDALGRAVTIDTSLGTGGATLNNVGTINGLGNIADAAIRIANNGNLAPLPGIVINNAAGGEITNLGAGLVNPNPAAGWAIVTTDTAGTAPTFSAALQSVTVNNAGRLEGEVWLGSGADLFNNVAGGIWHVSGFNDPLLAGPANQFGNGSSIINNGTIDIGVTVDPTNLTLPPTPNPSSFTGFVFSNELIGTPPALQTGTNTITNFSTINSYGNVNFQFLGPNSETDINNEGLFRVGSTSGSNESTSFTSDGQQFVTNFNSEFRVVGSGTGTALIGNGALGPTAAGPSGVGALNFTGADGSSFSNAGGVINMWPTGNTTTAVTLNTVALAGSSEATYAYAFGSGSYDFFGGQSLAGNNSRLAVNTELDGPGSTSDRLVIGGNAFGVTDIVVNNTGSGADGLNLQGITVVAVEGSGSSSSSSSSSSSGSNFVVSPTSANYVNFGPLGAINNGAFVDPLIYVPSGSSNTGIGPQPNAYKFFGVPGPFLTQLPVAFTAAQNIWEETALSWESRQEELRDYFQCGMSAAGQAYGGGADLPTRKGPPPAPVGCYAAPTMWIKGIASGTWANANDNLGNLNGLLGGLNYDDSYKQQTFGVIGGIDWGKSQLFGPSDAIVFGVMGGYITSNVNFDSSNVLTGPSSFTKFDYSGGTVGFSADYMIGGFFVDALVKADFLSLDLGGVPSGLGFGSSQHIDSDTWGVLGNIGYRWGVGRYFIEPLATFSWAETRLGGLSLPGAGVNVDFNNGDVFQIAGGVRAGGTVMDDHYHYLEASVTAKIWDRVSGSDDVNITSGLFGSSSSSVFNQVTLNNKYNNQNAYGEVGLNLDWLNRGPGWSAFIQASGKFNSDFTTVTGKAGVTYSF